MREFLISLWDREERFWICILAVGFVLGTIGAIFNQPGIVWCGGGAFGVAIARIHDAPITTGKGKQEQG